MPIRPGKITRQGSSLPETMRRVLEHLAATIRRDHLQWSAAPHLLFQQLYPSLRWAPEDVRAELRALCREYLPRYSRRGPWLRCTNRPRANRSLAMRLATESSAEIVCLRFTDKPGRLAAGTDAGSLLVWDLDSGLRSVIDQDRRPILALGPRSDTEGGLTAISASGVIRAADPVSLATKTLLKAQGPLTTAAVSPDGRLAALGSIFGMVELWDLAAGARLTKFLGRRVPITHMAFSGDGSCFMAVNASGQATVWSVDGLAVQASFSLGQVDLLFAAPPERAWWLGMVDRPLLQVDALGGTTASAAPESKGRLSTGIASACGRVVACATEDGQVSLSDHRSPVSKTSGCRLAGSPLAIAISPDLGWLAVASPGGKCELHRLSELDAAGEAQTLGAVTGPQLLPALGVMVWGAGDGTIHQLRSGPGDPPPVLATAAQFSGPTAAAAAAPIWAAVDHGSGCAWDLQQGKKLGRMEVNSSGTAIALSPDGRIAATGYASGVVTLWDTASGGEYGRAQLMESGIAGLDFSVAGGELVVTGANGRLAVFFIANDEAQADLGKYSMFRFYGRSRLQRLGFQLRWETALSAFPSALALSPLNGGIACAVPGAIRFFLPPAGQADFLLPCPGSRCRSLEYSRDGSRLLAMQEDGACVIWDLRRHRPMASYRLATKGLGGSWFPGRSSFIAVAADGEILTLALAGIDDEV